MEELRWPVQIRKYSILHSILGPAWVVVLNEMTSRYLFQPKKFYNVIILAYKKQTCISKKDAETFLFKKNLEEFKWNVPFQIPIPLPVKKFYWCFLFKSPLKVLGVLGYFFIL